MGLIKAIAGAAGGVMADQWKEYFYCEAMPANILATKGHKKVTGRSSNYKGDENIITNGSMIAVADGQCMLIVEQGKVVEVCAEPGEFLYDSSTEPSIFSGKLGDGIGDVFRNIGKRFTFGGEAPKDQRVYYFNTKELIGNKYGTASPVPFRVVDQRAAIDIDVGIRCFGEYSYHIANPLLFYTNVCGNVSEDYDRSNLDSQLKTELLTALQPAFAKISEMGIRYSALPGHTVELADALNEALSAKWRDLRGIEVVSFGVSSVTANEEDEKMIKEMQRNAAFMDPTRAAAHLAGATGDAMKTAAANPNGAVGAFMGMGMAGGMAGAQMGTSLSAGRAAAGGAGAGGSRARQAGPAPAGRRATRANSARTAASPPRLRANEWTCSCGAKNTGKFCSNCGKPAPASEWTCDVRHREQGQVLLQLRQAQSLSDPQTIKRYDRACRAARQAPADLMTSLKKEKKHGKSGDQLQVSRLHGPLRFDSATGKLQCDFCGSSYEVAEIEKLYAEKDAQAAGAFRQAEEQAAADGEWASASGSDWGADAEKLRVYSCPSCGAELICDETTSATSCPYCGNNTIVPGQFSGALKPDYVLPFKLG